MTVVGEGGYTGTRIGVTIANSLTYGFNKDLYGVLNKDFKNTSFEEYIENIDLKALKKVDILTPVYSSPPIITKKREVSR